MTASGFLAAALGTWLLWLASGCGDRCLAYDYGPPSARLTLRDASTGEPLCSRADYVVSTSRGAAIPHEDTCEWWLPAWTDGDTDTPSAEVELSVTGYLAQVVSIPLVTNGCGELQQPPPLELQLEPAPPE